MSTISGFLYSFAFTHTHFVFRLSTCLSLLNCHHHLAASIVELIRMAAARWFVLLNTDSIGYVWQMPIFNLRQTKAPKR
jgi:hypothetical protein